MNCAKIEILTTAERIEMKSLVVPMALLMALSVPALAQRPGTGTGTGGGGVTRGAPGPLVGAGLPVLLVAGGVYWLVRRKKRQARTP
jgi:LPXTG-motif cell wall-anchored protein